MKNFIQIGDRQITLDPTNQKEYDECINTCNHILSVMVKMGTDGIQKDEERVQSILEFSGKLGGDIAKRTLLLIANDKQQEQPTEPVAADTGRKNA